MTTETERPRLVIPGDTLPELTRVEPAPAPSEPAPIAIVILFAGEDVAEHTINLVGEVSAGQLYSAAWLLDRFAAEKRSAMLQAVAMQHLQQQAEAARVASMLQAERKGRTQ